MKTTITLLLCSLLIGCQATNTNTLSVPITVMPVDEKKANENVVYQIMKPVLCTSTKNAKTGINKAEEKAFAAWTSLSQDFQVVMLINREKETITLLEYVGNDLACFLSVGRDIYITDAPQLPTKGRNIGFKLEK